MNLRVLFVVLFSFVLLALGVESPCQTFGLRERYDIIIVGSGPGGSVSARRAAEAGYNVLLLERGQSYAGCEFCNSTTKVYEVIGASTSLIWNFEPNPNVPGNPVISGVIANIQGGGSAHNGMIWMRPNGKYYYDTYWPSHWNWDSMIPYYIKVENYTYPQGFYGPHNDFSYQRELRGRNGLIQVAQTDLTIPLARPALATARTIWPNIPLYTNFSLNDGYYPGVGTAPADLSMSTVRSSSWSSYIETYRGRNIQTTYYVRANKALFEGTRVIGVEIVSVNFSNNAVSPTCNVYAPVVISSGGTFGTPPFLQHSGIGPKDLLRRVGVPVVVDSPNVGAHFDDQFGILFRFTPNNQTFPAISYISSIVFWNINDTLNQPNPIDFQINLDVSIGQLVAGLPYVVYADSKGTVNISSNNPDIQPSIQTNYLSTDRDWTVLENALEYTLKWATLLNLSFPTSPCLTANCSTLRQQLISFINAGLAIGGNHWSGTAGLGRAINDTTMGVFGTQGLYVNDASAMVRSPGCHTQYTVYAVAERGIEYILEDLKRFHPPPSPPWE